RKKGARTKAKKRLYKHRMYILPDGTKFLYLSKWDHHGNLLGKVLADAGCTVNDDGAIPLDNKIVHRSVVEQAALVPRGQERFIRRESVTPGECKRVHEAICAMRARNSVYGPGDCYYGEPLDNVVAKVKSMSAGKIRAAMDHLESIDRFIYFDSEGVWVTNAGWRAWSRWNDKYFLNIVFYESGQDWPDWEEERDYWKDIDPTVWEKLNAEWEAPCSLGLRNRLT